VNGKDSLVRGVSNAVGARAGVEDMTYRLYLMKGVMRRSTYMKMCGQDLVCKRRVIIGS